MGNTPVVSMASRLPSAFKKDIQVGLPHRDVDVAVSLPTGSSGLEIRNSIADGVTLVYEVTERQELILPTRFKSEKIELVPAKRWEIINDEADIDPITHKPTAVIVGVLNDIEEKITHSSPWLFKAIFTIYQPQPDNEIRFLVRSEKDVDNDLADRGGAIGSGMNHDPVITNGGIELGSGARSLLLCNPTDGVDIRFDGDELVFDLPDGITYPFTFDPTVVIASGGTWGINPPGSADTVVRARNAPNVLFCARSTSIFDAELYRSTDYGNTWTLLGVVDVDTQSMAIGCNFDGTECAIIWYNSPTTYKPLFYRTYVVGFGFTPIQMVMDNSVRPDSSLFVACDENGVFHLFWGYSWAFGGPPFNTAYSNSTLIGSWPYADPGNIPFSIYAGWGIYASVWLESSSKWVVAFIPYSGGGLSPVVVRQYDGGWLPAQVVDVASPNFYTAMVLDSLAGDMHLSYISFDGSDYNVRYATKPWTGGVWALEWATSFIGVSQFISDISVDGQNEIHITYSYDFFGSSVIQHIHRPVGGVGWSAPDSIDSPGMVLGQVSMRRIYNGYAFTYVNFASGDFQFFTDVIAWDRVYPGSVPSFARYLGEMNTAKRNALPVEVLRIGNWIQNTDTGFPELYDGAAWISFA